MRTFLFTYAVTLGVLLRAGAGLVLHGLLRPRSDCAIEHTTGRVARA